MCVCEFVKNHMMCNDQTLGVLMPYTSIQVADKNNLLVMGFVRDVLPRYVAQIHNLIIK